MPYCYPPDPNTRKAKFTPPPNSCDTHFLVIDAPDAAEFAVGILNRVQGRGII